MEAKRRAITILLVASVALCGYFAAEGADWTLLEKTDKAAFYYAKDKKSVPGRVVQNVWVRKVYLDSGQRDYAVGLAEIDCARRTYSKIKYKVYNKRGTIMQDKGLDVNTLRLQIPRGSVVERLYDTVCADRF